MAESTKKSTFDVLNGINVSGKAEKRNGFTYLSWAWAWAEVKKKCPDAQYTVFENEQHWNYHTDGRTCWVKVSVTIGGLEHFEYLPIMDFRNNSIPFEKVTSVDVTRAIQRAVTKACARHGLGLYIYAGEDLPEEDSISGEEAQETPKERKITPCSVCGKEIKKEGQYTAKAIIDESTKKLGKPTCMACWRKIAEERRAQKEQEGNV